MPFRVGLVGLHRATGFAHAFRLLPEVELTAACDIDPETLAAASDELGIEKRFTSFDEFIDCGLDAVVVSTPMPFHAPQAAAALRRGIHVLSEVPAIVDLAQAWELVEAARSSSAIYMMAENYCYIKSVGVVREMARQGLFGTPYYGEGEYLHELKELNEITPWRRVWQTGIDGMTYGTHSLGPLLWWFGERVVSVSGFGSGHHYRDPRGAEYEQEDTCMMLCKTERGGLLRVRVDMLSNRPHLMTYYSLQGTKGCYEGRGAVAMWTRSGWRTTAITPTSGVRCRSWRGTSLRRTGGSGRSRRGRPDTGAAICCKCWTSRPRRGRARSSRLISTRHSTSRCQAWCRRSRSCTRERRCRCRISERSSVSRRIFRRR